MSDNYVLILFGNNAVSYNIASALVGSGIKPITVLPTKSILPNILSNKFYKIVISKYEVSSLEYLKDVINFVRGFQSSQKVLTLMTNDNAIEFWIKNEDKLKDYCTILNKDLSKYYDKSEFYSCLEKNGIKYPSVINKISNINRDNFPLVVKPATKGEANKFNKKFHSKIIILKNKSDFEKIKDFGENELIFQEKVAFDKGDEFSWCGYRSESGEIISFSTKHLKKFPNINGRISQVELNYNPNIINIGNEIVEKLKYIGIADIQFVYCRNQDTYYVIEMNPRLWCSHELLLMNGINLIKKCAKDYYKLEKTEFIFQTRNKYSHKVWYSILYYADKLRFGKMINTEYFNLSSDRIIMRLTVHLILRIKYIYYYMNRTIELKEQ